MIAFASLRVTLRRLRELSLRGEARAESRQVTAVYSRALRQLFVKTK
jgi:hypothetical protein